MTTNKDSRPDWMSDPEITGEPSDFDKAIMQAFESGDVAMLSRSSDGDPNADDTPPLVDHLATSGDGQGSQALLTPQPTQQSADEPPAGDGTQTQPQPDGYQPPEIAALPIELPNGEVYNLDRTTAMDLLRVNSWLQEMAAKPGVVEGLAALEQGTGTVVSAEEYARFTAWKQGGGLAPQQTQQPARPDLTYADPEVAAYVQMLEARQADTATPQGTPQAAPQLPTMTPAQQQEMVNRQVRLTQAIQDVGAEYTAKYELDDNTFNHLNQAVIQAGLVPALIDKHTLRAPSGSTIREADMATVMREAYETVMVTDPQLRQMRDEYEFNARLAKQQAGEQATAAKKARAGSIASTPSAAVHSGQPNGPLTPQQTMAGIAAALREAAANGTIGN